MIDAIFTVGTIILLLNPVLLLLEKQGPGALVVWPTLYIFSITYFYMGLNFSGVTTFLAASLWLALFIRELLK